MFIQQVNFECKGFFSIFFFIYSSIYLIIYLFCKGKYRSNGLVRHWVETQMFLRIPVDSSRDLMANVDGTKRYRTMQSGAKEEQKKKGNFVRQPKWIADEWLSGLPRYLPALTKCIPHLMLSRAVTLPQLHSAWLMISCGAQPQSLVSIMNTAVTSPLCWCALFHWQCWKNSNNSNQSFIIYLSFIGFLWLPLSSIQTWPNLWNTPSS